MKALRDLGFSQRAPSSRLLGWLSDGSDSAILLMQFLLRVRFVERLENISCAGAGALVWSFSQAAEADQLSLIPDADLSSKNNLLYYLSVNLVCVYPNPSFKHCIL